jgi:hypothetical protein
MRVVQYPTKHDSTVPLIAQTYLGSSKLTSALVVSTLFNQQPDPNGTKFEVLVAEDILSAQFAKWMGKAKWVGKPQRCSGD